MKKLFLTSIIALTCLSAQANYSPTNKTIKVVIPQGPTGGLALLYRQVEIFARQRNIVMMPVYKPGANSRIGIQYAIDAEKTGNTLLLSISNDMIAYNAVHGMEPISAISDVKFDIIASNKSNIKRFDDIKEKEHNNPGALNWGVTNNAHMETIKHIADAEKIDKNKISFVHYASSSGPTITTSIISGDVDLALMPYMITKPLLESGKFVKIEPTDQIKKKLEQYKHVSAFFLPKNSDSYAKKYWEEFMLNFLKDSRVQQVFAENDLPISTPGSNYLKQLLNR